MDDNKRVITGLPLGIDIGSTTIKCVVLDDNNNIIHNSYERHYTMITEKAQEVLKGLIDKFNIKLKANTELTQANDIIVRTLSQPTCSNVNIKDLTIEFTIDKELGIELVGETKVKIAIEEEEEPWDILDDDVDENVMKDIDETVDEEYIK